MGLGVWTTVEGVVYPSSGRYGGGFQWMVDDEDRTATNTSKLRLRPYIIKYKAVSDSNNDTRNQAWQKSYFKVDGNQKDIYTAFNFQYAKQLNTIYPVSYSSSKEYPTGVSFVTNEEEGYVEYEIPHNDNGTATVSVVGLIKGEASSNHFQKVTTNAAITLPPIQRLIQINHQGTAYVDNVTTLYIKKTNPDYVCDITYDCNKYTGTIVEKTNLSQIEWTVPYHLRNAIPEDASSELCKLIVTTYDSNGTRLGEATSYILLYVNATPTFDVEISTDSSDRQTLINGISTVTVTIKNAYPTLGASESLNFSVFDGERIRTTNPAVFDKATSNLYRVTVTDSRGLSSSKTVSIDNVIPYAPPSIGSVDIERDIDKGQVTLSGIGTWFKGIFDGVANKTLNLHVKIYEQGSNEVFKNSERFLNATDNVIEEVRFAFDFTFELSYLETYTFEILVDDVLSDGTVYKGTIRRAVPVFQWKEGTLRINGNLEVTGTYPGGSGGGGSYTEGDGIDISADGVISVETTDEAVQNDARPVSSGALWNMFKQINDVLGGV